MSDTLNRTDRDRIRSGELPNPRLGEDTDALVDLCHRWALLSGYNRQNIIRKAAGPRIESCIIAVGMKYLTELADPINGSRGRTDEEIRKIKDLLRSVG